MTRSAVVVGVSGGIGRALARNILADGRFDTVHGLARSDIDLAQVVPHRVDLLDEDSIAAAASRIGREGPVGLVIVATGVLHGSGIAPEKTFKALDPAVLARLFAVNAIGPALVAKHFVPLMPRSGRCVFAALSARVGSIEDNRLGGWYGYRASKAALNQLIRTLAIEVARSRPDAIVIGLHPGTVATGLSQPFRTNGRGIFEPDDAATKLLRVIESTGATNSGRILAWDGSTVPF